LVPLTISCSPEQAVGEAAESEYRVAHAGALAGPWNNRLAESDSPYLRLHAQDPVDWRPWGDEAFAEARRRGVPVFLSMGFYACHWCHVMQRETFQEPTIAAFLNDHFVSIKIDREVHPEIDALYMDAVLMLARQEGWPASLWLTPDREPFFAGTYFLPRKVAGRPGFMGVIQQISTDWTGRPADIKAHAKTTAQRLRDRAASPGGSALTSTVSAAAVRGLVASWSTRWKGWGEKQQFPMSPRLQYLLNQTTIGSQLEAQRLMEDQLNVMDMGGIHDQLGGGFHRYAADSTWHIPHFEKMLYDNAQLLQVYAEASLAYDSPRFAQVARGIAEYLLRELQAPQGGFFSSQSSETGGVEGGYYLWTPAQIRAVLPSPQPFLTAYGVTESGNFGDGKNVLFRSSPGPDGAALAANRALLLSARSRRQPPATDQKRVVAWNGLAISALCRAGRILDEPSYLQAADRAAEQLLAHRMADGGLPRVLSSSPRRGVLEDYAFAIDGLLDLFEVAPDPKWLVASHSLAMQMLVRFQDPETGGLYQAEASKELLARRSDPVEQAEPSGAGRAISALIRLRALGAPEITGEAIQRALEHNTWILEREPNTAPSLAGAAEWLRKGSQEVLLVAPHLDDPRLQGFVQIYQRKLRPHTVLGISTPQTKEALSAFGAFTGKSVGATGTRAYVCQDGNCKAPTEDLATFTQQLDGP